VRAARQRLSLELPFACTWQGIRGAFSAKRSASGPYAILTDLRRYGPISEHGNEASRLEIKRVVLQNTLSYSSSERSYSLLNSGQTYDNR
jgi:hypothetical protein